MGRKTTFCGWCQVWLLTFISFHSLYHGTVFCEMEQAVFLIKGRKTFDTFDYFWLSCRNNGKATKQQKFVSFFANGLPSSIYILLSQQRNVMTWLFRAVTFDFHNKIEQQDGSMNNREHIGVPALLWQTSNKRQLNRIWADYSLVTVGKSNFCTTLMLDICVWTE